MDPMLDIDPEQPRQKSRWGQFGTLIIAVCALVSSLWQGYSLQQHNKLAVRPVLQLESNLNRQQDGKLWFELMVNNNGLGPADVQEVQFFVGTQQLNSAHQLWPVLAPDAPEHCRGSGNLQRFYKVNDQQMLLRALAAECFLTESQFQHVETRLRVYIRYASLYGETFELFWGDWPAAISTELR
jgi:hypothetical protein